MPITTATGRQASSAVLFRLAQQDAYRPDDAYRQEDGRYYGDGSRDVYRPPSSGSGDVYRPAADGYGSGSAYNSGPPPVRSDSYRGDAYQNDSRNGDAYRGRTAPPSGGYGAPYEPPPAETARRYDDAPGLSRAARA